MSQLIAAACLIPMLHADDPVELEKQKLEGEWKFVGGGMSWNPKWGSIRRIKVIFKDSNVKFELDKHHLNGTFKLDPSKTPKRITVTLKAKKGPKPVVRGIYEFEGKYLKLRWFSKKREYPTEFSAKDGTYLRLLPKLTTPKPPA